MKLLITAMLMACMAGAFGQTIAKGPIKSDVPYQVEILHYGKDNVGEWITWDEWTWTNVYDIKIAPGTKIFARFRNLCNLQVTGSVVFAAGYDKTTASDTLYTDRLDQVVGVLLEEISTTSNQ